MRTTPKRAVKVRMGEGAKEVHNAGFHDRSQLWPGKLYGYEIDDDVAHQTFSFVSSQLSYRKGMRDARLSLVVKAGQTSIPHSWK